MKDRKTSPTVTHIHVSKPDFQPYSFLPVKWERSFTSLQKQWWRCSGGLWPTCHALVKPPETQSVLNHICAFLSPVTRALQLCPPSPKLVREKGPHPGKLPHRDYPPLAHIWVTPAQSSTQHACSMLIPRSLLISRLAFRLVSKPS